MRSLGALAIIIPLMVILLPSSGFGTVEYAGRTGKACGYCHVEATGGGQLTKDGEAFRDDLRIKGQYRVLRPVQRVVRFIIGYLHTLTAILWFGTILYVHIVLKPAYAAGGLPKSELMLGWISIIIMSVTGTLLSVARVPSWQMLFHTRFGILLTIKIILFLVMVCTALFVTFVIGPKLRKKKQGNIEQHRKDLNPTELALFDGMEGRPAYVAYQGMIYDVSGSRLWKAGSHFKKHAAGTDMTDVLKNAPHGEDKVLGMPVVGRLLAEARQKMPLQMRVFYFFAYMNLFVIFAIVFIVSLWRWW